MTILSEETTIEDSRLLDVNTLIEIKNEGTQTVTLRYDSRPFTCRAGESLLIPFGCLDVNFGNPLASEKEYRYGSLRIPTRKDEVERLQRKFSEVELDALRKFIITNPFNKSPLVTPIHDDSAMPKEFMISESGAAGLETSLQIDDLKNENRELRKILDAIMAKVDIGDLELTPSADSLPHDKGKRRV